MATQQLIINDFSGGLNTKIAPHLIAPNQCVDMENVTTETGILESVKGGTLGESVGSDHFALMSINASAWHNEVIPLTEAFTYVQGLSSMHIIENNREAEGGKVELFWYDTSTSGVVSTTDLTIPAPASLAHTGIIAWPGTNIDPWDIQYAVTAYDEERGVESAPTFVEVNVPSNSSILGGTSGKSVDDVGTNITGSGIVLSTSLDVSNTTADKFKFYRLGKLRYDGVELTEYRYIGEMATTGALGTIVWFYDGTTSENAGEILATANLNPGFNSNNSYRCIDNYKGRLFVSDYFNHKLYYSGGGSLNAFENDAYLELSGKVTGMASTISGLYIFTDDGKLSYLTGDKPLNYIIYEIGYATDVIHQSTVAKGKGFIIWVSKHGVMMASGYSVQNITPNSFTDIPDAPDPVTGSVAYEHYCAAIIDNCYYFMISADTLYKVDLGQNYAISKIYIAGLTQVFPYNNRLYANVSNSYYEMFTDAGTQYAWEYTTGEHAGQSFDSEMEYQSVKLAYIGNVQLLVYIDGTEVLDASFSSITRTAEKILLPAAGNKGLTIQFKLVGAISSKVYSIRSIYDYLNLEN